MAVSSNLEVYTMTVENHPNTGTRYESTAYSFSYHPPIDLNAEAKDGEEAVQPESVQIFGVIANVRKNTQAASLDLDEWNKLLAEGRIRMSLFEPAERNHSDFRSSVGLEK